MDVLRSVRARRPRPREVPGPAAASPALSWIGEERIAISGVPPARTVARLAEQGVTHVVNCRPRAQFSRRPPSTGTSIRTIRMPPGVSPRRRPEWQAVRG